MPKGRVATITARPGKMSFDSVLGELKARASPDSVEGMKRFGINPEKTLGISIPDLRGLARKMGKDHSMAQELWASGIHEARILAGFIDEPAMVTEQQMETWVKDFDSWDVCDQVCGLFVKTKLPYQKAIEWSRRKEEFVKRAAFALMASLAVYDKNAADQKFAKFLLIIKRESADDRNFVKKAVNWALRQIGKRNLVLNKLAIQTAREIQKGESRSAKWIASDALRELSDQKVLERLKS